MPDGNYLHAKPKDALEAVMCLSVLKGFRHWDCVLGRCPDCPKYPTPTQETVSDDNDAKAKIRFNHYKAFTKCAIHNVLSEGAKKCAVCEEQKRSNDGFKIGKIRTRKELARSYLPIGTFMNQYYLPMLEKYRYHQSHVSILSKHGVGTQRHAAFKGQLHAVFTKRDFAEAIKAEMNNEVQGDHFGKTRKMILEGCTVEFYSQELEKHTKEYHGHLLDDCKQNAAS